jgi:hypothetical protein
MLLLDVRVVQTDLWGFYRPAALEAEIMVLRQQINVLRRTNLKIPPFVSIDRR